MIAARTKYSLAFVFAFAIGVAMMPIDRLRGEGVEYVDVKPARGGDTLYVDGNLNGFGVSFNHKKHAEQSEEKQSCATCHHMNLPFDKNSGCSECHDNMYDVADVFNHDRHASPEGFAISCGQCHKADIQRNSKSAKKCDECHKDLIVPNSVITFENYMAPSYTSAMHTLCVNCHREKAATMADKEKLAECTACHDSEPPEDMKNLLKHETIMPSLKPVVLPEEKTI